MLAIAIHRFGDTLTHPATEEGVKAATIACIVLSMAAFLLFLQFIQNEGSARGTNPD